MKFWNEQLVGIITLICILPCSDSTFEKYIQLMTMLLWVTIPILWNHSNQSYLFMCHDKVVSCTLELFSLVCMACCSLRPRDKPELLEPLKSKQEGTKVVLECKWLNHTRVSWLRNEVPIFSTKVRKFTLCGKGWQVESCEQSYSL